jgi:hypothetical protein
MNRFDEIALEAGWIRPYEDVPLWYREVKEGLYFARFSISHIYEVFDQYPELQSRIDEQLVASNMNAMVGTYFYQKQKEAVLPMLASDYFSSLHNKELIEEELKYAKMSMAADSSLTPKAFSHYLKDQLCPTT